MHCWTYMASFNVCTYPQDADAAETTREMKKALKVRNNAQNKWLKEMKKGILQTQQQSKTNVCWLHSPLLDIWLVTECGHCLSSSSLCKPPCHPCTYFSITAPAWRCCYGNYGHCRGKSEQWSIFSLTVSCTYISSVSLPHGKMLVFFSVVFRKQERDISRLKCWGLSQKCLSHYWMDYHLCGLQLWFWIK